MNAAAVTAVVPPRINSPLTRSLPQADLAGAPSGLIPAAD